MPRHCYVLRVFTRGDEGGNHLGVVTDATSLTAESMQAIALELGYSETIFLEWEEGEIPRVRIFTPGAELPFAGHPLVGMAWMLGKLGPGGISTLRCPAFEVAIRFDDVFVSPGEQSNASVVSCAFTGMLNLYEIRLASGQIIRSAQPHTRRLPEGSRVRVAASPGHDLAYFAFQP